MPPTPSQYIPTIYSCMYYSITRENDNNALIKRLRSRICWNFYKCFHPYRNAPHDKMNVYSHTSTAVVLLAKGEFSMYIQIIKYSILLCSPRYHYHYREHFRILLQFLSLNHISSFLSRYTYWASYRCYYAHINILVRIVLISLLLPAV